MTAEERDMWKRIERLRQAVEGISLGLKPLLGKATRAAEEAEREAIADSVHKEYPHLAAAIRARGEK